MFFHHSQWKNINARIIINPLIRPPVSIPQPSPKHTRISRHIYSPPLRRFTTGKHILQGTMSILVTREDNPIPGDQTMPIPADDEILHRPNTLSPPSVEIGVSQTASEKDLDFDALKGLLNDGLVLADHENVAGLPVTKERRKKGDTLPVDQWIHKKVRKQQPSRELMDTLRPAYKPEYYFEDGLRRVVPYHYTYNTFCKERWRGKTLIDIFLEEFRDRPEEYYRKAIAAGSVTINNTERSSLDTIIRNGDIISHTLHRHEPPVTDKPIGIVHEDDSLIVINKPSGMPVHPAGRYNFNSVVEIMRAERNGFNPLPCNRLDRLTSGIMFIAKTPKAADEMMSQLKTRTIKKTYLARVMGRFPDGEVLCTEPILAISPKLGLNRVRANGKSARTIFKRLSYHEVSFPSPANDADTSKTRPTKSYSIVQCLPLTGRTHQIRVHLQWLGHPITNDPIYSNSKVFTIDLGKHGAGSDEDIITRLNRMGKDEVAAALDYYDDMLDEYGKRKAEKMTGEVCSVCEAPLYSDPGEHELGIYLHAKRYECVEGGWAFETEVPEWARGEGGVVDVEGSARQIQGDGGGIEVEVAGVAG